MLEYERAWLMPVSAVDSSLWTGIATGATGSSGPAGSTGATGPGATGPAGSALSFTTGNVWTIAPPTSAAINWSNNTYSYTTVPSDDVIIRRHGKQDIAVAKSIEAIMDRLCIIEPALDLIAKYPALREAYENYKMIEAMVKNGDPDDEQ